MPPRAPADELPRVEQHDPHHDEKGDSGHGSTVPSGGTGGPLSSDVFSTGVNSASMPGNSGGMGAAASLPFQIPIPTDSARPLYGGQGVSSQAASSSHLLTAVDAVVSRASRGDPEAFAALFTQHRGDVSRLVYRMLHAPADLEDVVQEVFVQVFRSIKDFRGQSKFSTWLHRVTVNVVLMHRRSARSRPVLAEEIPGELVVDGGQALPDDDVERRERMRAFQRLLAKLGDKKRIVFVLHELEGMSPGEIAEIVGAPVLTVRTRLFYARRELEAMLADEPTLEGLVESAPATRVADVVVPIDRRSRPTTSKPKPSRGEP